MRSALIKFTILALVLLILPLSGCTNIKENFFPTRYSTYDECFIKWSSNESKEKFHKGLGKSREEREKKHLLIPMLKNGVVRIDDKVDDKYIITLDFMNSRKTENFLNPILNRLAKPSKELIQELVFSKWIVTTSEMADLLEGYEEVRCSELEKAMYL